jgi:hypothetical protein
MDNIKLSQSSYTKITNPPFRGKLTTVKNSVLYMTQTFKLHVSKKYEIQKEHKILSINYKGPKITNKEPQQNECGNSAVDKFSHTIHSFIHSYSVDPHKVTEPYRYRSSQQTVQ